ncbi:unnamed protein product [Didymodactylos carnosus]|uniref:Neurotransmitter-gated ion-channel ligand-binding domain-containing protein n=1 Tax=Didymodactylos carnosus TaxID=1234261 RepID=A0A8S2HRF3_9BILA|nr:unnamed protein product [Didymodactylos carnosus]CAF3670831.1 unnamed protein product [Didymodactylos carnosus]
MCSIAGGHYSSQRALNAPSNNPFWSNALPPQDMQQVYEYTYNDSDIVPDEQRLMAQLLRNYDPSARPVYNASNTVSVAFGISLTQLSDMTKDHYLTRFRNRTDRFLLRSGISKPFWAVITGNRFHDMNIFSFASFQGLKPYDRVAQALVFSHQRNLKKKRVALGVAFDFAKAFDTVSHRTLLEKLSKAQVIDGLFE